MTTNRAMELLYDSEATLRLVDHELDELRGFTDGASSPAQAGAAATGAGGGAEGGAAGEPTPDPTGALAQVPMILLRANREIVHVLESLRQCRTQLETTTSDKLQITHEKLREVTSATEVAAIDILDGLDRAQSLIDEMDAEAEQAGNATEQGKALRNRLRDEVFTITGCLQFQDITTQQLAYASTVLTDMETRLGDIARLFDPTRYGAPEAASSPAGQGVVYSPDASFTHSEQRQAVADAIFTRSVPTS